MIKLQRGLDDTWTVELTPEFSVGGFESERSAGRWVIEYLVGVVGENKRVELQAEMQKQLAGAALLEDPKGKKQ